MKRIISIAAVLVLMAALLVGCGASNPVGKYVVKSMDGQPVQEYFNAMVEEEGVTLDAVLSSLGIKAVEEVMTLEIKDGGKFVLNAMGDESEGEWKQDGSKITLTMDGDPLDVTLNGNEISMDADGTKVVFVKK